MTYDKQKFEGDPNAEIQRAEIAANKFFDMAEEARVEEAQYPQEERYKEEIFSGVGRETAQGNFDKGQRILEGGVRWDDDLRAAASELNQLDQTKREAKPMSFEDAQKAMSDYARDPEKISEGRDDRQQDLENAMTINDIVADASEPGVEGIDNALRYIEGTLRSKNNTAGAILESILTPEDKAAFLKDWQEKRAIRDALYQEKRKRIEQQKQSQQATTEVTKERGSASRNLENLYTQAGVPEDIPSRQ